MLRNGDGWLVTGLTRSYRSDGLETEQVRMELFLNSQLGEPVAGGITRDSLYDAMRIMVGGRVG